MENEKNYDEYPYEDTSNTNVEPEPVVEPEAGPVEEPVVEPEAEPVVEGCNFVMVDAPKSEEASGETVEESIHNPVHETARDEARQETPKYEYSHATYTQPNYSGATYSQPNYTEATYVKPKKEKKKRGGAKKWILCVSMAIVFGVVASVVFQASNYFLDGIFEKEDNSGKKVSTTQISSSTGSEVNSDIAAVAENVMPSVVSITNLSVQEVQNFFFGGTTIQEYESSGSGIVIGQNDSELLIVSNNHVVEGSSTLTVSFVDGSSVEAQIKGTDADIDLAIIAVPLSQIEDDTLDAIKVATLGDSDALRVGEPAIAIGNALGYGQSVTYGIISAVSRTIDGFEGELIQTDAAINPGNSGGALLNANGEVIGINTAKVSADAVEGMGYAIPISDVNDVINELMNRETRTKVDSAKQGALGIKGISVDETTSELYGIPQGVQVSELIKGGAAEQAGIPKKCIITKFDGTRVNSMEDLQEQLQYYEAGETVEVVVEVFSESGEYVEKTYEVTLSKQSILN